MALKKQVPRMPDAPLGPSFEELLARSRGPAPGKARMLELAAKFGVDPKLPPRQFAQACDRAAKASGRLHPKAWAWVVLREITVGKRNPVDALGAAEALRLEPKEALRRAAEGWNETGAPKREPGEDREEDE